MATIVKKKFAEVPKTADAASAKTAPAVASKAPIATKKATTPATAVKSKITEAMGEAKGAKDVLQYEVSSESVESPFGDATVPPDALARVNFSLSYKHGIEGSYSSISVGISLTVPCHLNEAEKAYEFAQSFVGTRLEQAMVEIGAREPDEEASAE